MFDAVRLLGPTLCPRASEFDPAAFDVDEVNAVL
jgi:hypothetical protein